MASDRRDEAPRFHPDDVEEWWSWLADHHADPVPGVWVVLWRRASGHEPLGYEPLVHAALAYGWIDGSARPVDESRSMLWFTRRRPGSQWTRLSKERVALVEASGRMTDAGRAVIERAKADGTWTLLDDAEALVVPADLRAAFAGHPGAAERWETITPGRRRRALAWVALARRPATRAERVGAVAALAARGEAPDR